jgi:biotin carboxyl carrier protein
MRRRFRVGPAAPAEESGDEPLEIDLDEVQPESDEANPGGPGVAVGPIHWAATGASTLEVVVDGWRFELAVEDAARAELRRRATRAPDAAAASGPTEIRAIIPGRIAAVHVVAGDVVEAGQSLLVVEAMKMQNELRTSRAGTVERVAVGEGETIDNGDLLVVLR